MTGQIRSALRNDAGILLAKNCVLAFFPIPVKFSIDGEDVPDTIAFP